MASAPAIDSAMERRIEREMQPPLEPAPQGGEALTLADLIDAALLSNDSTRIAWAQAKARAAGWARARSPYYPTIDGGVEATAGKIQQLGTSDRSYVQMGVGLSYLLLDFGGRSAKAAAAREALAAANWSHNQAIQDVLRDVPKAYYTHLADAARVKAAEQDLREAATTLAATEARRRAGASTVSDVLQARAREARVKLDLASAKGAKEISRGALATVVGWPANVPLSVGEELGDPPVRKLGTNVDSLIADAGEARPDIGAAQALVRQRESEMRAARSLPFPKLTGTGTLGWFRSRSVEEATAYGGLRLEIPIFHGFDMENALREARYDLEAAKAQLKLANDTVVKEVWDAYQNYVTAVESLSASRALMASASESFDASSARYREGAADIVELLNAQSTLADARAQLIDSKSAIYTSYADLVRAVGERIPEPSGAAEGERETTYGENR
ncbi:MAG: TolC family protein [Proteobacteria bacterium]|nr:TolC family protein [Pseudomonadota bacterium]